MTYYIRNKKTCEDKVIENIDVSKGLVTVDDAVLFLSDVIENYEFRYDIW